MATSEDVRELLDGMKDEIEKRWQQGQFGLQAAQTDACEAQAEAFRTIVPALERAMGAASAPSEVDVRRTALAVSSELHQRGEWTADAVIADARDFEAYLRGERRLDPWEERAEMLAAADPADREPY